MSDAHPAANSTSLRDRLREKLPEIIIEAIFLALAVLTAFAVDAWRVERQQTSDAAVAVALIRAELKENEASVKASLLGLQSSLSAMAPLISRAQEPPKNDRLKIGFTFAMLSTASWTMAQNNQSLVQIGSKQSTQLAKIYELQGWFNDGQRRTHQVIAELTVHDSNDGPGERQRLHRVQLEFEFLAMVGAELLQEYALVAQ